MVRIVVGFAEEVFQVKVVSSRGHVAAGGAVFGDGGDRTRG